MKNKKFKAFTLAEVMIVLVVLGVIATLTVPALIQKQRETANRTKIKKAMSVYDTALNKMVIENGIKDNAALYESANSFAPEGNCTNTVSYFKVETTLNDNICTFKTSDGLYWNISKINNPVIAFSEDDLDNSEKSYKLVAHYDNNGILRVDDLQYERVYGTAENKKALSELYAFVNPSKTEEVALASSTDALVSGSSYSSGNSYVSGSSYSSGYSSSGLVLTPETLAGNSYYFPGTADHFVSLNMDGGCSSLAMGEEEQAFSLNWCKAKGYTKDCWCDFYGCFCEK